MRSPIWTERFIYTKEETYLHISSPSAFRDYTFQLLNRRWT